MSYQKGERVVLAEPARDEVARIANDIGKRQGIVVDVMADGEYHVALGEHVLRLRADDFFTDRRDTWRLLSNIGGEPYIELERNPGRPERACSGLYLPWPAGDQRDLSVALNV